MVIDFHTHVFPPEIRENRRSFFSGEPAFRLLYDSPKSKLVSARETIDMMDAQGVDKSVVFGFPWRRPDLCRLHNDYVIEQTSRSPDRLLGFCCVDPSDDGAPAEVERCLDAGLRGVGELAFYASGIDAGALARLAPVMAICRSRDCPVLIHTNEPVGHPYPGKSPNTLMQIYSLVEAYPENRLVLAHWGGGIFLYALLKKAVREALANVWFDTAASPFLYDARVYRYAADLVGAEKILFGTDHPLLEPARYFREIEASGLDPHQIRLIRGGNAAGLLGVGPMTASPPSR